MGRQEIDFLKGIVNMEDVFNYFDIEYVEGVNILCPFPTHEDNDPSFRIYENGTKFHCFGENLDGDVFDFVCNYKQVYFGEAIEIIKRIANDSYTDDDVIARVSYRGIVLKEPLEKKLALFIEREMKDVYRRISSMRGEDLYTEDLDDVVAQMIEEVSEIVLEEGSEFEYNRKVLDVKKVVRSIKDMLVLPEDFEQEDI